MIKTSARPLRLLFVDGNMRDTREGLRQAYGMAYGEAYAAEIAAIEPGIVSDICLPADEGANLPDGGYVRNLNEAERTVTRYEKRICASASSLH